MHQCLTVPSRLWLLPLYRGSEALFNWRIQFGLFVTLVTLCHGTCRFICAYIKARFFGLFWVI